MADLIVTTIEKKIYYSTPSIFVTAKS